MNPAATDWLPLGFHDWVPAAQAATLGLLTFAQEDVPAVTAALLATAGKLSWVTGWLGVFLGIWLGDALLYLLARGAGRPLLHRPWVRRFLTPEAVGRSERWFARRGTWVLLGSRFVPGTRLPTYLAAGFLRLPFPRFLAVTGIAVAIWTIGIFGIAHAAGPALLSGLQRFNASGWAVLGVVIALIAGLRLAMRLANTDVWQRLSAAAGRWSRWEFWPAWLFYLPVALNYLRLAIKYRGLMLPTAANPGIFSGGYVGESKIATLRDLTTTSPEFTAEAHLLGEAECDQESNSARVRALARPTQPAEKQPPSAALQDAGASWPAPVRLAQLQAVCTRRSIPYPFILKPDVGQRGVGVKLIRNPEQAAACLAKTTAPFLVQRYAPGPHELGIFYHRFPHERRGRIFAITEKIFPTLTGDGKRTVEELIWRDRRARFMAAKYLERLGERRTQILASGETLKLVEAGNHAQGCIFRDGGHLWSEALERRIDEISQRLEGFFIGRYDLRYGSIDDLRAGRNFQIIELNGAAAEATSIYDARTSLIAAYQTLFQQWELVFAIGAANRRRGWEPTNARALWHAWRRTNALVATYPMAD